MRLVILNFCFCQGIPRYHQECSDLILIAAKSSIYSTKSPCHEISKKRGFKTDFFHTDDP
ncbi:hypothetical protein CWC46_20385 [Prodigiosinella confusarubida]|uniref:Uncharacterized protein n=1 Tax=Serratia sp. (strain ATCC 39006) TaxID=104623 RepID=A0A2I5TNX8_SERS3|nr:hypothetical protein CWC46_20385 [Serratia sp. ATCC 39006]AUH06262.1 hypothetical protein Ser39006_020380 [Serratia sp. ATCC 39006]